MNTKTLTPAIAAMYFGAEVERDNTIGYIDASFFAYINEFPKVISECKLRLTPLSKISDADAIEVAEIDGYSLPCPEDGLLVIENNSLAPRTIFEGAKVVDYLRSKFYDCDNLIASGVAVDKTENI